MSQADSPDTTSLSRRAALARISTAAVALPLAVPVLADGEPDPIFAAIQTHQQDRIALREADAVLNRLGALFPRDAWDGDEPAPLWVGPYRGKQMRVRSHEELEAAFGLIGVERGLGRGEDLESEPLQAFLSEYDAAVAEFDNRVARYERGKAWRAEHGYDAAVAASDAATAAHVAGFEAMMDTVPTTLAGVHALLEHLFSFSEDEVAMLHEDWATTALDTVAASIAEIISQ
jgi:hypothetical protein